MPVVFVYGTLKRGEANHHYLGGQQFLHPARTVAGYTLYLPADYPGMVREQSDTAGACGEVWSVTPACLHKLDRLEGVDEGLYERVPISLAPPHERLAVESYLYLRPLDGCRHLGSTWNEAASD